MTGRRAASLLRVALVCGGAAIAAGPVPAQGVRITGTTTARYLQLRPMVDDSVPVDSTTGTGSLRETSRGVVAWCTPGAAWCHYRRTVDTPLASLPMMQDIDASMWGLGEGIHGRLHLRGRAEAGASGLWPQADDAFDVIAAYVDVDRARVRGRVGRQWRSSGLGYVSFDGVAAEVRVPWLRDAVTLDGWVGRSLVQGIHESVAGGAVAAVEDLAPDRAGNLFGTAVRYRPRPGAGLAVAYQRELRSDRSWLYSERVAVDGSMRVGRAGSVDGALELDLASGDVNEGRLRARHPMGRTITVHGQVRTYKPFFELWTIWGAFSPVAFTEVSGGASWSAPIPGLVLGGDAAWRRYGETDAGADFLPMRSDGWRAGINVQWQAHRALLAHASWRTEIGFGAARTDADAGVRWTRGENAWLGAVASLFQSAYELRVGTGRVAGLGIDGGFRLPHDVRLAGDLAAYRHAYGDLAPATNWSQLRGSLRLEWTVGADPGMAAPRSEGAR